MGDSDWENLSLHSSSVLSSNWDLLSYNLSDSEQTEEAEEEKYIRSLNKSEYYSPNHDLPLVTHLEECYEDSELERRFLLEVEAEINKIKLELSEKGPDRHRNLVERCGSSAICAVIHGRTLFVANAGDSRAVLCRKDGVVVPLSEDHKPNLEREKKRIYSSGGFVSSGRVNGCLALSRGFGDFQYKNNGSIPPKAQAVTCDPDITAIELEKEHEFLIIACDGIWDCMSSEEACKYIQDKLRDLKQKSEYQQEEKTPLSSIITNMFLEKCLAEVGDLSEVGSDNMTCIVVLFNDDLFQEDQV